MKRAIFSFFILCSMLVAFQARAATMYVRPVESPRESEIVVDVVVSTDSAVMNAVQGDLLFPTSLNIKRFETGGSPITFWVHGPALEKGAVNFSGVVPGGVALDRKRIFSVVFEPVLDSTAPISYLFNLQNVRILKNDGDGTELATTVEPATVASLKIVKSDDDPAPIPIADNVPPEPFTIAVSRNAELFNNKWFVAFNTSDNSSGIGYYEMQESKTPTPEPGAWRQVTNPAVLNDQSLESYILVRAVDRAGNMQIAVRAPQEKAVSYTKLVLGCILLGVLLIALVSFFVLRGRQHEKEG